jgi:hypothetical protein
MNLRVPSVSVFVVAVTFLPSGCLATYIYRHAGGKDFRKYAVEMGSGAMVSIPSFINIGSGIQKLIEGNLQAHRQHGVVISQLFLYFF